MKAKLYQQNGTLKGEVQLPDAVFAAEVNEHVLHQVIKSYLANQRQGTSKTKTRAEVSGGGRKPWRQKGTGRARAGSNTSPVWVRGGKAFGPETRDYYTVIPRKLKKIALSSALSSRAKDEKVVIVDSIQCQEPKTKTIADLLGALSVNGKKNLLIVDVEDSKNVYLSGRNIKNLEIKMVSDINAYDVIHSENIIFGNEKLIEKVEEAVAL
ncbi:50S ribosomal protein L4 [Chitinispirillales bacterium ANBcel5]|uniref:50S ribosomal protein L4 n=1 Tax=Cellulosispirillum alkaliphilum TaxID=3039283 RepID=UPI002A53CE7D|nr:50S ribosomal protein L4 [Chitinispirillales bacterium ANBcel5]